MRKLFESYISDESGATAVEYGLLAALFVGAMLVSITSFGQNMNEMLNMLAVTIK